ncbi:MAG TPA: DUF1318 domain-containing protein [Methylomirabilota bacterium]|jgi:uncharacterized protein YdbL (DUF1318 family)|nr:DUF1318 domain-containing protein [Methylomirabilota bacterium]
MGQEVVTRRVPKGERTMGTMGRIRFGCHVGILVLTAVLAACVPVTVNITFPQEKLDDAANQIVDMSRRPEGVPPPGSSSPGGAPPKPGSSLDRWPVRLGPREAFAEERRIEVAQAPKTDSVELRRLTESQNQRLGALQQWMARGCIGESNQGLVEPRPGQGCSGEVARLIGDENRDRQAIIETFIRQNNMAASEAGRVKASFAKAYRERAQGGQWIQTDQGEWVKK